MMTAAPQIATARELLKGAKDFHLAAELCHARMKIDDPSQWLLQPQMANNAFAAELALKGLHALHLGGPARGHDLVALFEPLPASVKGAVRGPAYPLREFDKGLQGSRDAFETWRYAHEHARLRAHLSFLAKFAVSVIAVLEQDIEAKRLRPAPSP